MYGSELDWMWTENHYTNTVHILNQNQSCTDTELDQVE